MKKTFLTRRNALLSTGGISWGGYALIVAIVLLGTRLVVPNLFWHLMTPVLLIGDKVGAESHVLFSGVENAQKLSQENDRLRTDNESLEAENQTLLQRNLELAGLVGPSDSAGQEKGTVAGVVARPPQSPYDTLLVAKGLRSGVMRGMEVFGPSGLPVGTITSAWDDFSQATLFTSPGLRTSAWVGKQGAPLTLVGSGAGTLAATIARAAGIEIGESVFVPGPGKLPIGKVVRVDSDPSSPSVTLRVQLDANPFSITTVTIRDVGSVLQQTFTQATSTQP